MGREKEQCGQDGESQRESDAGRLELEVEPAHDEHDEQAADSGVDQEIDHFVNPGEFLLHQLVMFDAGSAQGLFAALDLALAVAVPDSLLRREREHFAFFTDSFDLHVRIDHGLRYVGVATVCLSRGAHQGAHVRLVLVGHDFTVLVHHGGRA